MDTQPTILNELKELNSSLPLPQTELYTVPDGYFDNLASVILSKIKSPASVSEELESLSPILAGIPRTMPFSVPENYFNQLPITIPGQMQEDELPAILARLDKAMPYRVPAGYFDNLPATLVSKIKPQAKVVSFNTLKWMRYAAAAMIIGIIALGGIFYFTNNKSAIDPIKHPHEWIASKLQNVSNKDLDDFINTADVTAANKQVAQKGNSGKEVRKLLHDVSDSELDAFLKQLPADNNETLVN